MNWFVFAVQWLHVLLGIVWFGGVLTTNFIVVPALMKLPLTVQRDFTEQYGLVASRLINIVAPLVILLGVLRGTVFGRITSLDDLGTAYGITWLVALVFAIGTFAFGKVVIEPALHAVRAAAVNPDGTLSADGVAAIDRVKRVAALEMLGFAVIFTCMILMRFQ